MIARRSSPLRRDEEDATSHRPRRRRVLATLALAVATIGGALAFTSSPAGAIPNTVSKHGCTVKVGFSYYFPGTAFIENQGGCRYIGIAEYYFSCAYRSIEIGMWNPPLWQTLYNNGLTVRPAYYAVGHAIAYDGTQFWVYVIH
jgi:hypothetical protein